MRRVSLLFILSMLVSTAVLAGEDAPAVLTIADGSDRSYSVFLMSTDGKVVNTEFQKLRTKKTFEIAEIGIIDFTPIGMNNNELKAFIEKVDKLFQQAEYEQLIELVEPVTAPYGGYMSVNNNLQEIYGLLMKAYSRSGKHQQADAAAANLMQTADASLKLNAMVCAALAAADRQDFAAARELHKQISDPAAALYVQASIERAEGSVRDAIQSAVEVIADHADSLAWMPSAEFLCAELYLDNGRTNSAAVTARQTAKIYS